MNVKEACTVLGVQPGDMTENAIMIAFRRAAKLTHPDHGGMGVQRVVQAKDLLLKAIGVECKACDGKGSITGFTCRKCKGRGRENIS